MAKGKHGNVANRNQGNMVPSKPNYPTTVSPRHLITPEKQDVDLKSLLIMLREYFKKDINNCLKEGHENICQKVESLKKETQKIA